MNPHRLLVRIAGGDVDNVAFHDLARLLIRMRFVLRRTNGSHHIYIHPQVPQAINIQEVGGKAKPYQARQVVRLIERYNLSLEDAP